VNDDINENPTIDEILKERRNVFDNDEFDILRNGKIDMNKVILGKKKYVYCIYFYNILLQIKKLFFYP